MHYVRACMRARARARVCVCVWVCVYVRGRTRGCVRACVRVCVFAMHKICMLVFIGVCVRACGYDRLSCWSAGLLHLCAYFTALFSSTKPSPCSPPPPSSPSFRFMPFLVLSARLCPPGIEGTLFALFMSAFNFGNTLGGYLGASLASHLGITATSFDNLTAGILIQAACTLLPILMLSFVPASATGARHVRSSHLVSIYLLLAGGRILMRGHWTAYSTSIACLCRSLSLHLQFPVLPTN